MTYAERYRLLDTAHCQRVHWEAAERIARELGYPLALALLETLQPTPLPTPAVLLAAAAARAHGRAH